MVRVAASIWPEVAIVERVSVCPLRVWEGGYDLHKYGTVAGVRVLVVVIHQGCPLPSAKFACWDLVVVMLI